jgi:hypothetical protein
MRRLSLIVLLLFFVGCNSDDIDKVKVIGDTAKHKAKVIEEPKAQPAPKTPVVAEKIKLQTLESKTKVELATIESKTKKELKSMELEAQNRQKAIDKEIQLAGQQTEEKIAKERYDFYKIALIVLSILTLLLLLVIYFIKKKSHETQIKLQKARIENEREMKQFDEYNKRVHKMLDIVSQNELPETTQNELLTILKDINQPLPSIDDNKKRITYKGS